MSQPSTPSRSLLHATRRDFLRRAGLAGAAVAGLSPLGRLLASAGASQAASVGYGPLRPVADRATGLPLLQLPDGFSYTTFGWTGEPLPDGRPCPRNHDGMGVVASEGDVVVLVRNHEITTDPGGSFAPADGTYDPDCAGGTTTLRFDTRAGELLSMQPSLSGTLTNCAGGVTPWGTWLSCEEIVLGKGQVVPVGSDSSHVMKEAHGFVFEVPASGLGRTEPLLALGQMRHEAATVDPATGIVYLTEDASPEAGFYRMLPTVKGELHRGGRLQMLRAVGASDLRRGRRVGERFKVEWVEIEDPTAGVDADGGMFGLVRAGKASGASVFTRLEGIIAGEGRIWFISTDGGDARCGQLWVLHPGESVLELVYESPDPAELDYPDNIVLSPRGGLVICEDSRQPVQRLYGRSAAGGLFEFCRNNVELDGQKGFTGRFVGAEWAGACFSPDGRWLFANVYNPGFTVAITGPWKDGLI